MNTIDKITFLDVIPEDISYLIFSHINDYYDLLILLEYESFKKVILSKFSYYKKLKEKYPFVNDKVLNDFKNNLKVYPGELRFLVNEYEGFNSLILDAINLEADTTFQIEGSKILDAFDTLSITKYNSVLLYLKDLYVHTLLHCGNFDCYISIGADEVKIASFDRNMAINIYLVFMTYE